MEWRAARATGQPLCRLSQDDRERADGDLLAEAKLLKIFAFLSFYPLTPSKRPTYLVNVDGDVRRLLRKARSLTSSETYPDAAAVPGRCRQATHGVLAQLQPPPVRT